MPNGRIWYFVNATLMIFVVTAVFAAGGAWVRLDAAEATLEGDKAEIQAQIQDMQKSMDSKFRSLDEKILEQAEQNGETNATLRQILRVLNVETR